MLTFPSLQKAGENGFLTLSPTFAGLFLKSGWLRAGNISQEELEHTDFSLSFLFSFLLFLASASFPFMVKASPLKIM